MVKYVYICSAAHSGSTLLDLMIGSHSKAESLGEVSHLPKNISLNSLCGCGKPVQSCSMWQDVLTMVSNNLGTDILKNPYALNLGYINPKVVVDKIHKTKIYQLRRKIFHGLWYIEFKYGIKCFRPFLQPINQAIENNFLLYDAVRTVCSSNIIVDSSKTYLKAIGLYRRRPEEVRVILLVRDGRGVFYSYLRRNVPKRESLDAWKNFHERALPLFDECNIDILTVKYEELVKETRRELGRICDFLNIGFEEEMLNYAAKPNHTTNGNEEVRFRKLSEIKLDTSWCEHLSDEDQRYFESRAGQLNRKLGYK